MKNPFKNKEKMTVKAPQPAEDERAISFVGSKLTSIVKFKFDDEPAQLIGHLYDGKVFQFGLNSGTKAVFENADKTKKIVIFVEDAK